MALVVVASNILVQFPVQGQLGSLALADILTWGAFTYPFAFLVTDLANRRYGPAVARRIVFVGFMVAVVCSIVVPPLLFRYGLIEFETAADRLVRIAIASGAAFLVAQLLDVTVFNRLRRRAGGARRSSARWPARCSTPRSSSPSPSRRPSPSSAPTTRFALETAPLLGVLPVETPRWISWALGDLGGEADHRGRRADPLPADRRPLEPAGSRPDRDPLGPARHRQDPGRRRDSA